MTVQELIDQLDNFSPDQVVHLSISGEDDQTSVAYAFDVGEVTTGGTGETDVHISNLSGPVVC